MLCNHCLEEVTGEPVEAKHEMSVIVGILDTETLKHTAQFQGAKADVKVLKRKVMEFVNLMSTGKAGPDAMDIGRVEKKRWADDDGVLDEEVGEDLEYEVEIRPGMKHEKVADFFSVDVHVVAAISRAERRVALVGVTPTVLAPRGGPKAKAQIVEL